jgi:hypothetical protein
MSHHDDYPEAPPYPEEKDADLEQKYFVPFDDSTLRFSLNIIEY